MKRLNPPTSGLTVSACLDRDFQSCVAEYCFVPSVDVAFLMQCPFKCHQRYHECTTVVHLTLRFRLETEKSNRTWISCLFVDFTMTFERARRKAGMAVSQQPTDDRLSMRLNIKIQKKATWPRHVVVLLFRTGRAAR